MKWFKIGWSDSGWGNLLVGWMDDNILLMYNKDVSTTGEFPVEEGKRWSTDVCCTMLSSIFALTLFILACVFFNAGKQRHMQAIWTPPILQDQSVVKSARLSWSSFQTSPTQKYVYREGRVKDAWQSVPTDIIILTESAGPTIRRNRCCMTATPTLLHSRIMEGLKVQWFGLFFWRWAWEDCGLCFLSWFRRYYLWLLRCLLQGHSSLLASWHVSCTLVSSVPIKDSK